MTTTPDGATAREALLPCPFCGGEADPQGWRGNDGSSGPECDGCGATAPSFAAWNRRPALAAQGERVRLAERLEALGDEATAEWEYDGGAVIVDAAKPHMRVFFLPSDHHKYATSRPNARLAILLRNHLPTIIEALRTPASPSGVTEEQRPTMREIVRETICYVEANNGAYWTGDWFNYHFNQIKANLLPPEDMTMADHTQHMTFVERYRMQPDIAAALIEWRDACAANKGAKITNRTVMRYHKATQRIVDISKGLPKASDPAIVKATTP